MPKMRFPQYRKARQGVELFSGTLLEHARRAGVEIPSDCGGLGKCGRCIVRVERGAECMNSKTEPENGHRLAPGERLACQARVVNPQADVTVFVKELGAYSIVTQTVETEDVPLEPFVHRDGRRVVSASGEELGRYRGEIYGLALDVGTTTLALQVVDLEDGRIIATAARTNPQISYGNDIISRIGHTMAHQDGLAELQQSVIGGVNEQLAGLEPEHGELRGSIFDAVVVGNSTMRGIFFGQDVSSLGVIPFEPVDPDAVTMEAGELGLRISPQANVYGGALIGGHAGADALADVIASRLDQSEGISMVIDIGTNGEVVVGNRHRMMSASCAAGGAYEGATVTCGSGAVEGAISNVWITDGQAGYETIGGKPPVGVCGSGLIDLLAEMLRTGRMSRTAKIGDDFCLADGICITQQDIYELITAKAGLRLDQDLLMRYYGVELDQVQRIFLAGGFGNFINAENAVAIGLLPPAPEKVVRIGNGALAGAREMLINRSVRRRSEQIARSIEHTKPNEREPDFPYLVAEKMYF
ncbi:MAG: ASKHA domain-containing protein [Candidatus Brocadiia bacterium]